MIALHPTTQSPKEELTPAPAPNRRLVAMTAINGKIENEVTFIEVDADELVTQILVTLVGSFVWAATLDDAQWLPDNKVILSFSEEVGLKEIPITPPKDFIEVLNRRIEADINTRMKKIGATFSYLLAETYIELSLTSQLTSPEEEDSEEEL